MMRIAIQRHAINLRNIQVHVGEQAQAQAQVQAAPPKIQSQIPVSIQIRNASSKKTKQSGLQKQVLGLYRTLLRTSHNVSKRGDDNTITNTNNTNTNTNTFRESIFDKTSTVYAVKNKFRKKATSLNKRDLDRIEYNIRQGEKYVKTLEMNGVKGMRIA